MLLKILLLQVMSIGLITVPIKAQGTTHGLEVVPDMYMLDKDKAILNSLWNLAGYSSRAPSDMERKFSAAIFNHTSLPHSELDELEKALEASKAHRKSKTNIDNENNNEEPPTNTGQTTDRKKSICNKNNDVSRKNTDPQTVPTPNRKKLICNKNDDVSRKNTDPQTVPSADRKKLICNKNNDVSRKNTGPQTADRKKLPCHKNNDVFRKNTDPQTVPTANRKKLTCNPNDDMSRKNKGPKTVRTSSFQYCRKNTTTVTTIKIPKTHAALRESTKTRTPFNRHRNHSVSSAKSSNYNKITMERKQYPQAYESPLVDSNPNRRNHNNSRRSQFNAQRAVKFEPDYGTIAENEDDSGPIRFQLGRFSRSKGSKRIVRRHRNRTLQKRSKEQTIAGEN
ncbi:hypothetical protein CBL_04387 [Carabus blaptoides fortunei]